MAHLETFSTIGLDPRRKIEYWNEQVCASFTPNSSEPADLRAFNGHIARTTRRRHERRRGVLGRAGRAPHALARGALDARRCSSSTCSSKARA